MTMPTMTMQDAGDEAVGDGSPELVAKPKRRSFRLVHPGFPGDSVRRIPSSLVVWSSAASARSNWWTPVSEGAVNPGLHHHVNDDMVTASW